MKEEIANWRKETGINLIKSPKENPLREALEITEVGFATLDGVRMAQILDVLSSYHVYLHSELGRLNSRAAYYQKMLDHKMLPVASKYSINHAGERRAMAIKMNKEFQEIDLKLSTEITKVEMLKPIVESLKLRIYILRDVFNRSANVQY